VEKWLGVKKDASGKQKEVSDKKKTARGKKVK
jgi:hypothetical protein